MMWYLAVLASINASVAILSVAFDMAGIAAFNAFIAGALFATLRHESVNAR